MAIKFFIIWPYTMEHSGRPQYTIANASYSSGFGKSRSHDFVFYRFPIRYPQRPMGVFTYE